jgi:hypothetical protein
MDNMTYNFKITATARSAVPAFSFRQEMFNEATVRFLPQCRERY